MTHVLFRQHGSKDKEKGHVVRGAEEVQAESIRALESRKASESIMVVIVARTAPSVLLGRSTKCYNRVDSHS